MITYFIYLQLNIFNILHMEQHVMVQSQGRFSMSSAGQTRGVLPLVKVSGGPSGWCHVTLLATPRPRLSEEEIQVMETCIF